MKDFLQFLVIVFYSIILGSDSQSVKPTPEQIQADRTSIAQYLLWGCPDGISCARDIESPEYEGYDGWYNNPSKEDLGAIDTPLLRRVPAAYEDGVYKSSGKDRPNPLELSRQLLSGQPGSMSKTGKNALLVFFGQQVVEEILDAQRSACPPEYINIPIPEGHEYRDKPGHTEMPVLRTRFKASTGHSPNNPRQQLNEITPYIDGGLVYGTTKAWSDQLRTYANGTLDPRGLLATSHEGLFPEYNSIRLPMANPPPPTLHHQFVKNHQLLPVNRFFKLGNPRGNENTFLLTFGILWFRWHNHLARALAVSRPNWSGEKIYNEARKWTIATQQHIVVNEWLPAWLNEPLKPYEKYDPSIDPQIDQFFQSAAFRFGHTLVPPGVYLRDYGENGCKHEVPSWNKTAVRTCNSFWRPQDAIKTNYSETEFVDIDRLLMGMAFQACEREDHIIVEDLRGRVFGPLEFSRRDLMALNIQRGRDHGLPDFNTARKAYNLQPITSVDHFRNVPSQIRGELMSLYGNKIDDIDIWVGGILETGDGPGEFFRAVIKDQFQRIRDGDRFWYRNSANGLFTSAEVARLENLKLRDIILAVTKMASNDIQENVFQIPLDLDALPMACKHFLVNSTCSTTQPSREYSCYHLPQLNQELLNENCTDPETYDYFSNSEISYILTFAGLTTFIIGLLLLIWILIRLKEHKQFKEAQRVQTKVRESFRERGGNTTHPHTAEEWIKKGRYRHVAVLIDTRLRQIQVKCHTGKLLRAIQFENIHTMMADGEVTLYHTTTGKHLVLQTPHYHDLVLKFNGDVFREAFIQDLDEFFKEMRIERSNKKKEISLKTALKLAVSQERRQKDLEKFFRVVFSQAFKIENEEENLSMSTKKSEVIVKMQLTIHEFADALGMRPTSEFIVKMFRLVDKDRNGFVSFREFLDLVVLFYKGTADDKLKHMFDMYDINNTGTLRKDEFRNMLKSFMDIVKAEADDTQLDLVVDNLLEAAQLQNKASLSLDDFKKLLAKDKRKLERANLSFAGTKSTKKTGVDKVMEMAESFYTNPEELQSRVAGTPISHSPMNIDEKEDIVKKKDMNDEKARENISKWSLVINYLESYNLESFWKALYTMVLLAIFAERAYYYTVEREHSGLRRIAGLGVTVTRGAASAMMFTYSTLLLTMCRNSITKLRETALHLYVPFDRAVELHKYIASWALLFTVIHIIGHAFNFYHISTQTSDDLTCLFRNYFHATHEIPKFHYWCWQTLTGVTGVALTLVTALIYIFTLSFVRRKLYKSFWLTHSLYPIFFVLMILHGAGRLIQAPFFHYFFLGPVILFVLDMCFTITRRKVEIPVVLAEALPSEVTMLQFQKPNNFSYKSGQWVRIACRELGRNEFHPFTLSSSPHEENLSVHIRAVGPWTRNIRKIYDNTILREGPLPMIRLDGPYGEAHQDWYKHDVAILVGGGIGVTPFASILKDIVYNFNLQSRNMPQKIYFLWVTRTQRQFEWLIDIIRDLENSDKKKAVSVHLFITQFYKKFDLRTILLYICETRFQKLSGRSLFTGLKAVTHFARPNFYGFFSSIRDIHPTARSVGVFSCGPRTMSQNVEKASLNINSDAKDGPLFTHNYTNF